MKHDLLYSRSGNDKQKIRDADNNMMSALWKHTSITRPIEALNNIIHLGGIGAKVGLEKLGLASTENFTDAAESLSKEDE